MWKGWGQNNFGLDLICPSSSSCVSQVIGPFISGCGPVLVFLVCRNVNMRHKVRCLILVSVFPATLTHRASDQHTWTGHTITSITAHYQHSSEHPGGSECFSAAVKVKMHRVCSEPGHTHTLWCRCSSEFVHPDVRKRGVQMV